MSVFVAVMMRLGDDTAGTVSDGADERGGLELRKRRGHGAEERQGRERE